MELCISSSKKVYRKWLLYILTTKDTRFIFFKLKDQESKSKYFQGITNTYFNDKWPIKFRYSIVKLKTESLV